MGSTPLTFRCSKCKVGEDWRNSNRESGNILVATGRERFVTSYGPTRRGSTRLVEVLHKTCGTKSWTSHPSWAGNAPRRFGPGA